MTLSTLETNLILFSMLLSFTCLVAIHLQQKAFYSHIQDLYKIATLASHMDESLLDAQKELTQAIDSLRGEAAKVSIKASIAEKYADRANTLASSANIGVAILQRGFQVKKIPNTPAQDLKNKHVLSELIKKDADMFEWLGPVLTEEERKIAEFAQQTMKES